MSDPGQSEHKPKFDSSGRSGAIGRSGWREEGCFLNRIGVCSRLRCPVPEILPYVLRARVAKLNRPPVRLFKSLYLNK